jgi:hypothetical protein
MSMNLKRLAIGYPCLCGGIVVNWMLPNEMECSRADAALFVGVAAIGLWIVAAILFVRK